MAEVTPTLHDTNVTTWPDAAQMLKTIATRAFDVAQELGVFSPPPTRGRATRTRHWSEDCSRILREKRRILRSIRSLRRKGAKDDDDHITALRQQFNQARRPLLMPLTLPVLMPRKR